MCHRCSTPDNVRYRVGVLLSDRDIADAIARGAIRIDPWRRELLQPASVDVTLDNRFRVFQPRDVTDPAVGVGEELSSLYKVPDGDSFLLLRGEFVLASTVEWISLDAGHAARVEGKSSLGRLGLMTHVTAGFVDPGFRGSLTLELFNVSASAIRLWPGMPIAQLCFMTMLTSALDQYGSRTGAHYMQQDGPTESQSHVRWRVWPVVGEPGRSEVRGGPDVGDEVGTGAAVPPEPGQHGPSRLFGVRGGRPSPDHGFRPPH